MSNSVKRFEVFRMFFAIVISLLISFVIIFLVSKEPLTAIYTLITGPFKSRRNFANGQTQPDHSDHLFAGDLYAVHPCGDAQER